MRRANSRRQARNLERVRARFERWRQTRPKRRIPEELWSEAVELAHAHGVDRTARALRLNGQALRKRARPAKGRGAERRPTFVEVPAVDVSSLAQCVVVVERPGGAWMRIELRGARTMDIAALARGFAGES